MLEEAGELGVPGRSGHIAVTIDSVSRVGLIHIGVFEQRLEINEGLSMQTSGEKSPRHMTQ